MKRLWHDPRIRRIVTLSLGWMLVLLGIAGLFLPVLQGVALILLGLYVLSRESRWARSLLDRIRRRYPRLDERLRSMKGRLKWWRGGGRADGDESADGCTPEGCGAGGSGSRDIGASE